LTLLFFLKDERYSNVVKLLVIGFKEAKLKPEVYSNLMGAINCILVLVVAWKVSANFGNEVSCQRT